MSQSPLARSTRRSLPAFAHAPSRLSKSTSSRDLAEVIESRSPRTPTTPALNGQLTPSGPSTPRYRSAGTSTPHTPKIHYSPYATSTPPGGLSKSTSIPFDMAASAKAARRADEEASRRGSDPALAGASTRKKRFVRKKPLLQRMFAAPNEWIDQIMFHAPTSVQDLLPPTHLANPISLVLHALMYLLLAPLLSGSSGSMDSVLRSGPAKTGVGSRWDKWEEEGRVHGRGLGGGWTTLIFTALLIALAAANSLYLFTRFRTYDMQLRSGQETIPSPHASPVPSPHRSKVDEDIFAPASSQPEGRSARKLAKQVGWILVALIRWSFRTILAMFGHRKETAGAGAFTPSEDKIQSLRVWDPPDFCLAFFCAFPPSAPLLSYLLTPLHPWLTPLLHLVTSFLLSHLAASYAQLVKDRMVLSAEVMREYDRRFVYKRVFGSRVDRGVGTHEAEMVW